VDKATADVETAVQQMREGETRARDEMREIREEVNNIREMVPKVISPSFRVTIECSWRTSR
jgi:peroxin-14